MKQDKSSGMQTLLWKKWVFSSFPPACFFFFFTLSIDRVRHALELQFCNVSTSLYLLCTLCAWVEFLIKLFNLKLKSKDYISSSLSCCVFVRIVDVEKKSFFLLFFFFNNYPCKSYGWLLNFIHSLYSISTRKKVEVIQSKNKRNQCKLSGLFLFHLLFGEIDRNFSLKATIRDHFG